MRLEDVQRYGDLSLIAKSLVEGFMTGMHRSPYRGFSVEYAEHKMYNPGESIRHIDWRIFTKTGRLYVKQYEEETNLRAYFVLDVSGSMYYPAPDWKKLRFALFATSALLHLLHKQRDAVGLFTFAQDIKQQASARTSLAHVQHLLQLLAPYLNPRKASSEKTACSQVLHEIAERIPKRSMVIVFTDVFASDKEDEDLSSALQHLRHQHHEVLLFHVKDEATEAAFSFGTKPYRFEHIEGTEKILLRPEDIRQQYQTLVQEAETELKECCGELKISFLPVDVGEDFDKVFLRCLALREKMF